MLIINTQIVTTLVSSVSKLFFYETFLVYFRSGACRDSNSNMAGSIDVYRGIASNIVQGERSRKGSFRWAGYKIVYIYSLES